MSILTAERLEKIDRFFSKSDNKTYAFWLWDCFKLSEKDCLLLGPILKKYFHDAKIININNKYLSLYFDPIGLKNQTHFITKTIREDKLLQDDYIPYVSIIGLIVEISVDESFVELDDFIESYFRIEKNGYFNLMRRDYDT